MKATLSPSWSPNARRIGAGTVICPFLVMTVTSSVIGGTSSYAALPSLVYYIRAEVLHHTKRTVADVAGGARFIVPAWVDGHVPSHRLGSRANDVVSRASRRG